MEKQAQITVGTTNWNGFPTYTKPDNVVISYAIAGSTPFETTNPVHFASGERDLILYLHLEPDGRLGLTVATEINHILDTIDFSVGAIKLGHELAISWVFAAATGSSGLAEFVYEKVFG
jgi:hypothetical protein